MIPKIYLRRGKEESLLRRHPWIFSGAIDHIEADDNLGENNYGRITKYAAEALFARAYLFYSGYYGAEPVYSDGTSINRQEALAAVENMLTETLSI